MKIVQLIRSLSLIVAIACISPGCEKTGGTGPQGIQGEHGPKGEPGDRGASGSKGEKGERGDAGPAGAKGGKGDRGDTGSTGSVGAQGAKGTRGDTGPQGIAGPRGAQGATGIGNVIYSGWISPTADQLTADGALELIAPKLTSAILNTGEVYVYLRPIYDQSDAVFLLEGHHHSYYDFHFSAEVGRLLIYTVESFAKGGEVPANHPLVPRFASHGLQDPDPIMAYAYRYVFIPGGTKVGLNINPADYRSVRRQLGLTEPNFNQSI